MSLRNLKNLPEWLELDYYQRPRSLKTLWKPVILFTLTSAVVAMLVALVVQKKVAPQLAFAYQAGPLTSAHAMFNNDCGKCHVEAFRTLTRLGKFDGAIRAVPDETCQQCHAGPVHHAKQIRSENCVSCHREHHGAAKLALVSDASCTNCHADLAHAVKPGETTSFQNVARFADHPPFVQRWEGAPADPGTISFNHAVHLDPRGVSVLHDPVSTKPADDRRQERRTLNCQDCHVPDAAGRTMLPIRYESHCKSCHPLTPSLALPSNDEAVKQALAQFSRTPAPHLAPEIVRGVLRDRLTQLVKATPSLLQGEPKKADEPRAIPGTPPSRPEVVSREEFSWVGKTLIEVEKLLFWSKSQSGCAYCHQRVNAPAPKPGELPTFAPSKINERTFPGLGVRAQWFPHARFKHDSHRMLDCVDCHDARTSRVTTDVLLPGIDTCRRCHNGTVGASARTDCAECHTYHPSAEKRDFRGRLSIDQALGK
jgi:hypothetical protein